MLLLLAAREYLSNLHNYRETLPVHLIIAMCIGSALSIPPEKIVGGKEEKIERFPYMLSLRIAGNHACGACIINNRWAVTAAHCVATAGGDPKKLTVRSGSTWRDRGGRVHRVVSTVVHDKFDNSDEDYDIALLVVNPPFSFNNSTRPVLLATNSPTVDRSWAWISGWGYTDEDDPVIPSALKATEIPQIEWEQCVRDYKSRFVVTPRQVCYGLEKGMADSCKGDSGGPLVNEDFQLLGITSWGAGCGAPYSPGVYTNALLLHDWIFEKISAPIANSRLKSILE